MRPQAIPIGARKGLIVMSLILMISQAAHALEFECHRTSETTSGPKDGTAHKVRLKIDLQKEIVIIIDGCATTTYSNASDPDTTGLDATRCPPSRETDPLIKQLEQHAYDRHAYSDEAYHVDTTADTVEWGLENRQKETLSTLNFKKNTMELYVLCRNCVAAWSWRAIYQCKKL